MLQEYIHIQQEETFKFKFDCDKLMMKFIEMWKINGETELKMQKRCSAPVHLLDIKDKNTLYVPMKGWKNRMGTHRERTSSIT